MKILVTGLIGQYAFGGVAWDYIQYVLGFRALGHEVWYFEDTGAWAYDPVRQEPSADCGHNVRHLAKVMEDFGLADRWIYRNEADGTLHGADRPDTIMREADLLVNVSGACWLREETSRIPKKLFLDGDPLFTQVTLALKSADDPHQQQVRAHDAHFSFGLNLGEPDCLAPDAGIQWHPTIQPVDLAAWESTSPPPPDAPWTTVMNWSSYKPVGFQGRAYGQKDIELEKFLNLPARTRAALSLAVADGVGGGCPREKFREHGWTILDPAQHTGDHHAYRTFIHSSQGEWSIAKNGYVAAKTGWFSCRSACYLAAGRPVVVQDTGWTKHLPHGTGLLAFDTPESAAAALDAVMTNPEPHRKAALDFAREHLDAPKVCADLLA